MSIGNYAGIIHDFDITTSCYITSLIKSHMTFIEQPHESSHGHDIIQSGYYYVIITMI